MIDCVWVSWRDRWGWHPRHAVPTQLDSHPDECAGLLTLCGRYVPEGAVEYAYSPKGPCRRYERSSPTLAEIMHRVEPHSASCRLCRAELARAAVRV